MGLFRWRPQERRAGRCPIPVSWPHCEGRYSFDGQVLQLERNDKEGPNAIHGFVRMLPWKTHRADANCAVFDVYLDAEAYGPRGYPFSLAIHVTYTLDTQGFSCSFAVQNVGAERRLSPWDFIPTSRSGHPLSMRPKPGSLVQGIWSLMIGSCRQELSLPRPALNGIIVLIAGSPSPFQSLLCSTRTQCTSSGSGSAPAGRRAGGPADFLLSNYSSTERKELPFQVDRAADAVESLLTVGLAETQQRFNS